MFGYRLGNSKYNSTSTTAGGYYGSVLNQQVIGTPTTNGNLSGTVNERIYYYLGNHLKTFYMYFSNDIAPNVLLNRSMRYKSDTQEFNDDYKGISTNGSWQLVQTFLPSEIEITGSWFLASSYFDIRTATNQFPAFKNKLALINGNGFALRDLATAKHFSKFDTWRCIDYVLADSDISIRPCVVLA